MMRDVGGGGRKGVVERSGIAASKEGLSGVEGVEDSGTGVVEGPGTGVEGVEGSGTRH